MIVLTRREREVAIFLMLGLSTKEIARRLIISPRTVDDYIGSLFRKYEVTSARYLAHKLWALA